MELCWWSRVPTPSLWASPMAWVKRKHQLVLTWWQCLCGRIFVHWGGKSTKDTVNSIAITAHKHTLTITHIYMYTHMHRRTHTMVIQHFASLQLQIWNFHEHMHKHHLPSCYHIKTQMWSNTFVALFFLLSVCTFSEIWNLIMHNFKATIAQAPQWMGQARVLHVVKNRQL